MGLTDNIARFLMELLEESDGGLEVQRQQLAQQFGVVPSQINYVLSSRFRPEQGYVIESRRGGGGYIRIYRVESDTPGRIMHIVNAVGNSLDAETAGAYFKNMLDYDMLTREQTRLIGAAVSDKILSDLPREPRNALRAKIFKNMLVSVLS